MQRTTAKINVRNLSSSPLTSTSGTQTPGHLVQKFNTHERFGKSDTFVRTFTHTCKFSKFITGMNRFSIW